jgi:ornithine cyclodeaminase
MASTLDEVLRSVDVVSIATNATVPHIHELPERPFVIRHLSLRDIAPNVIARCTNIVDDIEHVSTAKTPLPLATEALGRRDFIRGTIPDLLSGAFR